MNTDTGAPPGADIGAGDVGRHSLLTGEDTDLQLLAQKQLEALEPLKEDLADWLNKLLGTEMTTASFMTTLDTGVLLCKLANLIQKTAEDAIKSGKSKEKLTTGPVKYQGKAQVGSWFARDNAANFLQWCRQWGVKDECLFESEGLVSHKDEKSVVLCLLELARIGSRFGMEPPTIIKLEKEIDKDQAPEQPKAASKGSAMKKTKSVDALDKEVQKIANNCKCTPMYQIKRLAEGKYNMGGRNMFIRLLKGKHVMVRVGGGWDTLTHYLLTHDPCKITEFKRTGKKIPYTVRYSSYTNTQIPV